MGDEDEVGAGGSGDFGVCGVRRAGGWVRERERMEDGGDGRVGE